MIEKKIEYLKSYKAHLECTAVYFGDVKKHIDFIDGWIKELESALNKQDWEFTESQMAAIACICPQFQAIYGHRRVGKSLVIARKAVNAATSGLTSLILVANSMLIDYMKDCFTKLGVDPNKLGIGITSFQMIDRIRGVRPHILVIDNAEHFHDKDFMKAVLSENPALNIWVTYSDASPKFKERLSESGIKFHMIEIV